MKVLILSTFWLYVKSKFYELVHDCSVLTLISIPAIFSWQLTEDNTLHRPAIIQIPGKPLDLAIEPATGKESPRIITALDPSDPTMAKSLAIYSLTMTDEKLATSTTALVSDADVESAELDIDDKVVRGLLYNTESLRKQPTEREEERGEEQVPEDQLMGESEVVEEQ